MIDRDLLYKNMRYLILLKSKFKSADFGTKKEHTAARELYRKYADINQHLASSGILFDKLQAVTEERLIEVMQMVNFKNEKIVSSFYGSMQADIYQFIIAL